MSETPHPAHLDLILETRRALAGGVYILGFRPAQGNVPDFEAGQYAMLNLPGIGARAYSIASAPGGERIELHVKNSGRGAGRFLGETLPLGGEVSASLPHGEGGFVPGCPLPVLAIAGGVGIAPVLSICRTALAENPARPVRLYAGVSEEAEFYAGELVEALAGQYPAFAFALMASGSGVSRARTGRALDGALADIADLTAWRIYVSGPPAMVADAVGRLFTAGVDPERLHYDHAILNQLQEARA